MKAEVEFREIFKQSSSNCFKNSGRISSFCLACSNVSQIVLNMLQNM